MVWQLGGKAAHPMRTWGNRSTEPTPGSRAIARASSCPSTTGCTADRVMRHPNAQAYPAARSLGLCTLSSTRIHLPHVDPPRDRLPPALMMGKPLLKYRISTGTAQHDKQSTHAIPGHPQRLAVEFRLTTPSPTAQDPFRARSGGGLQEKDSLPYVGSYREAGSGSPRPTRIGGSRAFAGLPRAADSTSAAQPLHPVTAQSIAGMTPHSQAEYCVLSGRNIVRDAEHIRRK